MTREEVLKRFRHENDLKEPQFRALDEPTAEAILNFLEGRKPKTVDSLIVEFIINAGYWKPKYSKENIGFMQGKGEAKQAHNRVLSAKRRLNESQLGLDIEVVGPGVSGEMMPAFKLFRKSKL